MRDAIYICITEIKKLFFSFILLGDDKPSILEKIEINLRLLLAFAPIAYMLEISRIWFKDNSMFTVFVLMSILINMGVGGWYHYKYKKDFDWMTLLKKTAMMMFVLIVTYYLLEQIRIIAGQNIFSDGFKVVIQTITLFYPSSKALKNIYIMSNKEYPPAWIMERVYNFEKTGDLDELLRDKAPQHHNSINAESNETYE